MKARAWRALLAAAIAFGGASDLAAGVTSFGIDKFAQVREKNTAGEEIDVQTIELVPGDAYWASMPLGDGHSAFGATTAEAFVHDDGTFWVRVDADNSNPPYTDGGNGEATTRLTYGMHKPATGPAELTLHLTGGRLWLIDGGGGNLPLSAAVLLSVEILPEGLPAFPKQERFAALIGRGGSTETETFEWSQEGFDLTEANYTERGFNTSIIEARLDLPAQDLRYDFEQMCGECDFVFSVELSAIADNPGGETRAYAYYRDPVHLGDAEPDLGGAFITYEGLTLLAPEPDATAEELVALAAGVITRRARRRR